MFNTHFDPTRLVRDGQAYWDVDGELRPPSTIVEAHEVTIGYVDGFSTFHEVALSQVLKLVAPVDEITGHEMRLDHVAVPGVLHPTTECNIIDVIVEQLKALGTPGAERAARYVDFGRYTDDVLIPIRGLIKRFAQLGEQLEAEGREEDTYLG